MIYASDFTSLSCTKGHKMNAILKRFRKYLKPDPASGCWLWTGCLCKGYGNFSLNGTAHYAHRWLWEYPFPSATACTAAGALLAAGGAVLLGRTAPGPPHPPLRRQTHLVHVLLDGGVDYAGLGANRERAAPRRAGCAPDQGAGAVHGERHCC